jgi:hypothetical protein
MLRKKKPDPPPLVQYLVQIGRDPKGRFQFLGYQGSCELTDLVTVDVGRPFEHKIKVPGPSGLEIEGLDNCEPWSPSQVIAGARLGWFGFKLEA